MCAQAKQITQRLVLSIYMVMNGNESCTITCTQKRLLLCYTFMNLVLVAHHHRINPTSAQLLEKRIYHFLMKLRNLIMACIISDFFYIMPLPFQCRKSFVLLLALNRRIHNDTQKVLKHNFRCHTKSNARDYFFY